VLKEGNLRFFQTIRNELQIARRVSEAKNIVIWTRKMIDKREERISQAET
jgi:hypothetical protein